MISNNAIASSSLTTGSSETPTVSPVTIIVNPNLSNKYQAGECGNKTVTCNNLIDAMESFMKVATLIPGFPNKQYSMYQQLNLLLTDGIYQFESNSISLFNMNVTMTTLTANSNSVIFSGGNSSLTSPLFSISNGNVTDNGLTPSYIQISGIQFQINQTLLNVTTVSSFTDFKISDCQFLNYNNQLAPMFTINQGSAIPQLPLENSAIYFTNSTFNLMSTGYSTPLMSFGNTIVKLNTITASNGVVGNFIKVTYCSVNIDYSNFYGISTLTGLFNGFDSCISIFMDRLTGNKALSTNVGGSIISMVSDTTNRYYFELIYSTFVNNSASGSGGIVSAINTQTKTETQVSYILNSTFTGSSSHSSFGGVAYLINTPVTIETSTFGNSTSNIDGSILYFANSNLIVTNSTIIDGDLASPSILKPNRGGAVDTATNYAFYTSGSNVTFQSTNMYKVSIDCLNSVVNVNTVYPATVGPNDIQCTSCLLTVGINQAPYCNLPQTTSSSTSSSSTSLTSSSTSSPSTTSTTSTTSPPTTSTTSPPTTSTTSTTSKTSTTTTTSTTSTTSAPSTASTSSPSTSSTSLTSSTSSTTKTASSSSSLSTSGTGTSSSSSSGGHISFVVASSSSSSTSTSTTSSTSSVFQNSAFGLFVIISFIISLIL
ncbi:hypothetical protein ACTFIY_003627 [Dictyostelium cf. discoideum]